MIIHNPVITGSFQVNGTSVSSIGQVDTISGSVDTLNSATSSYALKNSISGAFDVVSSSLASRVASQESFSSSLDNTFATDSDLNLVSSSVDSLNAATSSYALKTQISGSFTSLSASLSTRLTNDESSVTSLNAATSSYLQNTTDTLTGDLTVTGTLTAQDLHVQEVTSSIVYSSGSNIFGASSSDIQTFYGSVGIGTNNPQENLHITDPSDGIPVFRLEGSSRTYQQYVDGNNFYIRDVTGGANRITLDSTGSLGIGYTSPSSFNQRVNAPHLVVGGGSNSAGVTIFSGTNDQGSINFADGTTTTDQYTGGIVYVHGSDNYMTFHTNGGTERMRINNSGSLGIGTTSPIAPLTVKTAGGIDTGITLTDGSSHRGKIYYDGSQSLNIAGTSGPGGADTATLTFLTGAGTQSQRMVITRDGNVGIGTTSPARKFHVTAPDSNIAAFESDTHGVVFQDDGSRFEIVGYRQTGATYNDIHLRADVDNTLVLKATTGKIGIGTASPAGDLEISGSGASLHTITFNPGFNDDISISSMGVDASGRNALTIGQANSQNNSGVLRFIYSGAGSTSNYLGLGFYANDDKLVITPSGNVGIGATSPSQKLHVKSATTNDLVLKLEQDNAYYESYFEANSQDGGFFRAGISNDSNNFAFFNTDQAAYRWYGAGGGSPGMVYTNGRLGIGTTSPNNKLSVLGNANFGSTLYSYAGPAQYGAFTFPRGEILFSNTNTQNQLYLATNAYNNSSGVFAYRNSSQTAISLGMDNGAFNFLTAGSGNADAAISWSTSMIIQNDGNVGINTTSATKKLHVVGDSLFYGHMLLQTTSDGYRYIGMNTSDGADNQELILAGGGTASGVRGGVVSVKGNERSSEGGSVTIQAGRVSTGDIIFKTGVTVGERMRIDESGNVGIGTSSPIVNFEVYKSGARLKLTDGTNQMNMGLWDGSNYRFEGDSNRPMFFTSYQGNIYFGISGATTMTVRSGGVGIGTTDTPQALNVNGTIQATNAGAGYVQGVFVAHSSTSDTPSYRGQGYFTYNEDYDVSWYMGTPYTNGDFFCINRQNSATSFDTGAANIGGATTDNFVSINNSGHVGIGTSAPQTLFHVHDPDTTYTNYGTVFLGTTAGGSVGESAISLITAGDALAGFVGSNFKVDGTTYSQTNASRSSGYINFVNTTTAGRTSYMIFGGTVKGSATLVERMRINDDGNVGIGTTSPGGILNVYGTGTAANPTLAIDTTSSSQFVHTLEALTPNLTSGQHNIMVVGKEGSTKNSGYVGYTWAGAGSDNNFVTLGHWGHDDLLRIYGNGDIRSGTNYKSAGWNWVTTPYHYYVATTSQASVTVAVNSGFTVNGNSAIPSYAKALYVTYYYHISGYGLGDAGQGDHASDIWGPDAPATTTSWSFTTSGNHDWGSAVFMHDGDASESGDIGYYGIWHAGAIIPVNTNGNIYGLLAHGYSGGTHYHHMYVWGYAL